MQRVQRVLQELLLGCFLSVLFASQGAAQDSSLDNYSPGDGMVIRNPTTGYRMQLKAYSQFMFESRRFDGVEETYNRFRARRMRMRIVGSSPSDKLRYRVQFDLAQSLEGDDEVRGMLLDGWVAFRPSNRFELSFGQRATPLDNLELQMASSALQLTDRSRLTSAFSSIRDFGLFASGRIRAGSTGWFKMSGALTNGDGANAFAADHGGLKVGARVNWLPFGLFRSFGEFREADLVREIQPKLLIGSYGSMNRGMSSRRGRESGAILYLDSYGKEALPDYWKWGLDILFKFRGFTFLGEYVNSNCNVPVDEIAQRVRNDGSIATTFAGGVDAYVRGRMILGSAWNAQAGYVFKNLWSIDARVTRFSPDDNSFLNNVTFYNRNAYYEVGTSKYFGRDYAYKVQASAIRTIPELGSLTVDSDVFDGNEWTFRLLTQMAF